jgi:hypothetical protein
LAGRSVVDTIIDVPSNQVDSSAIDKDGDLYWAVSENNAVIKRVKIPSDKNLDPDSLARFEITASLLESADEYYVESYRVNGVSERLAIAYHRTVIDQNVAYLQENFMKPSGFRLRSWAMASGYLNCCHHEGGNLICLVDINLAMASYCFIQNNLPIDVGIVMNRISSKESNDAISLDFILDIVATIEYRLAGINRPNISVPLSLLLITGSSADSELARMLENRIGVKTGLPNLKKELFANDILPGAFRYLVCLGLLVV